MIIGIMGAMPDEVDQLCARLADVTKENYAGVEYHCGTLQGKQVVVCCAGQLHKHRQPGHPDQAVDGAVSGRIARRQLPGI